MTQHPEHEADASYTIAPQSLDAERGILAAMMLRPEALETAKGIVRPEDFYRESHRLLFDALVGLHDRGESTDLISIREELGTAFEKIGGVTYLAEISEATTSTALVERHAQIVRRKAIDRQLIAVTEELRQAAWLGDLEEIAKLGNRLRELEESHQHSWAYQQLCDAHLAAPDFLELEIEKPRSLLGDGLLVAGSYNLLHGDSGIGKTFVTTRLADSIARGASFGEHTTAAEAQVAILSLEIPDGYLQDRLQAAVPEGERPVRSLQVLRTGVIGYTFDLGNRERFLGLRRWLIEHSIDLLVLDPLNRTHVLNENDNAEVGQFLSTVIHPLRQATGTAILLVHHDGKPPIGSKRNPQYAFRGASRWRDDAQSVFHLEEHHGSLRLSNRKCTHAPE
ncbi:MAG: AAA family ATPase, partial [Dehalococcoidia bacterium]